MLKYVKVCKNIKLIFRQQANRLETSIRITAQHEKFIHHSGGNDIVEGIGGIITRCSEARRSMYIVGWEKYVGLRTSQSSWCQHTSLHSQLISTSAVAALGTKASVASDCDAEAFGR